MPLKIRYRAPSGGGTIDLDDGATVGQLFATMKEKMGSSDVGIKYGWPPKALEADQADVSIVSLNLHRENLTIVPADPRPNSPQATSQPTAPIELTPTRPKEVKDMNVTVQMLGTGTYLVLRVMPDDNSCMFTAVGGALRGKVGDPNLTTPMALRRAVVSHIEANPDRYTKVILENMEPAAYCRRILRPDTWGGYIDLVIISEIFGIQIDSISVLDGAVTTYGENNKYDLRCVLVYSNIHYDRVAEIFDEDQVGADFDVTTWSVAESDHIIENAKKLCKRLKDEFHYYTDTSGFVVRCNDCGWIGQGEKAVVEHSRTTGHIRIEEIPDN